MDATRTPLAARFDGFGKLYLSSQLLVRRLSHCSAEHFEPGPARIDSVVKDRAQWVLGSLARGLMDSYVRVGGIE